MANISTKHAKQSLGYRLRELPIFIHDEIVAELTAEKITRQTRATIFKRIDFQLVPSKTTRPILSVLQKYGCPVSLDDLVDTQTTFHFDPQTKQVFMNANLQGQTMEAGQPA